MSDSSEPKDSLKFRIWLLIVALVTAAGLWLGLANDIIGIWGMFQPKEEIDAEILEHGLRNYLDEQK